MNITIINGTPDESWAEYEDALLEAVEEISIEHNVDLFKERDMDIAFCCGCFSCWMKTPGVCIYKDDMIDILKSLAKTNLLLFVTPLITAFVSSNTKKIMDRMIPIVLPYIEVFNNESHHPKRYDNEAALGILILDDNKLDDKAIDITYNIIDRLSLNFHGSKVIKATASSDKIKEVLKNEISNC